MRLKRKSSGSADIDVTAFSDIAFLMIIFFILTTTFVRTAGSKLTIPSGTADEEQKEQKQLTVNLDGSRIFYGEDNVEMSIDELRAKLFNENLAARAENERTVIVDSSADVPYEHYYRVLMAISRAGGVVALIDHEGSGS